jgi:hypothetical protein
VLANYDIDVTDEELADIERVIDICQAHTTSVCIVPLARPRPHGHKDKNKHDDEEC